MKKTNESLITALKTIISRDLLNFTNTDKAKLLVSTYGSRPLTRKESDLAQFLIETSEKPPRTFSHRPLSRVKITKYVKGVKVRTQEISYGQSKKFRI